MPERTDPTERTDPRQRRLRRRPAAVLAPGRHPRRATAAVLGATALVVAVGCSGSPARHSATTTTAAPAPTTTTTEPPLSAGRQFSFFVPTVGVCFDIRPAPPAPPIYLQLDCSIPHQNEVFATFDYTATKDYPGLQVLMAQARLRCPPSWNTYVARPYETSRLALDYLLPDQAGWNNGIRHVVGCLVVDPTSERRVGSARGIAQ